ncbi:MAG: BPL-N domain-containing protein [Promethearchaeota archaeon]
MFENISTKTFTRGVFYFVLSFTIVSTLLPTTPNEMLVQAQTDLSDINVGVYNDLGAHDDCAIALYHWLAWMSSNVIWINSESIHNGTLNALDLVAFPGGSHGSFATAIGLDGIELVRQFVENGGSYVGYCGGAMFGTEYVGLASGYWSNVIPGMPSGTHLEEMVVNQASTGPDLSDEPASYEVLYWGSAYFDPTDNSNIIPIMSYTQNDEAAMFVVTYGYGTAFLCGPHPEFEEGSDRDGITLYDYLDDPDSEWDLLKKVTQWLIDESLATPPPNPFAGAGGILILVGATIVVVTIGIAVFVLRRRSSK